MTDLKVGDIVITDQLIINNHLNGRPLRVERFLENGRIRVRVLCERDNDPLSAYTLNKRTVVNMSVTKVRKL